MCITHDVVPYRRKFLPGEKFSLFSPISPLAGEIFFYKFLSCIDDYIECGDLDCIGKFFVQRKYLPIRYNTASYSDCLTTVGSVS